MYKLYQYSQKKREEALIEDRNSRNNHKREESEKFFFDSIGDDTYLDLIREKIEFLIDEGYKYSEQIEMINRGSGREISYRTYVDFVKREVLQDPSLLFQQKGANQFPPQFPPYGYYPPQQPYPENSQPKGGIEEKEREPKKEETATVEVKEEEFVDFRMNLKRNSGDTNKESENIETKKSNVGGTKITPKKSQEEIQAELEKKKAVFQHEAMPEIDKLY